jgi:hypothetical protein
LGRFSEKKMIITGGVLLVVSVILSALQVAKVLPANFIISIISFLCLVGGVCVGMMGIFAYVKKARDAYYSEDQHRRR